MELVTYVVVLGCLFLGSNVAAGNSTTYNVRNYGALGDGRTDDTKGFESAWKAACTSSSGNVTVIVPPGNFLVSRIQFQGPCKSSSISFQILGMIVAPPRSKWRHTSGNGWLYFNQVDGLTVNGNGKGVINGNGQTWWSYGDAESRPTAIKFSLCNGLTVSGLKHSDSQRNHVSINQCNNVIIKNLHIVAPETSPNTDGINICRSTNVKIHDCIMETGDDCIAINGGTSRVNITGVACGPGHGISVGSLGKDGIYEEVEDIAISNCSFHRTQNGIRIKTWQGGSGFARCISFSNINFDAAYNPVVIDQFYCPHKTCSSKVSAVKISNVTYTGLRGTSMSNDEIINFTCSKTVPCTDIRVDDVNIVYVDHKAPSAQCINAHVTERLSNIALNCSN